MDWMNSTDWDFIIEDTLRNEPQSPVPSDFTRRVMLQIQLESLPRFQVFSWLDLFLSLGVAMTLGVTFLLPLLLPEQARPWLHWMLQMATFQLQKSAYNLPFILFIPLATIVIGAIVWFFRKELKDFLPLTEFLQQTK
ncbi:MAG: hypothetical protein CVU39_11730 [Chloroflexi bacterium HGW-Chloroflexi-10]|nr:MAG: hypothetical protein CVU39_11730 [Chloroflexi bacterium HGW-Chloroflexi-10]